MRPLLQIAHNIALSGSLAELLVSYIDGLDAAFWDDDRRLVNGRTLMRWAKPSATQSNIHPRIHFGQMIFDIAQRMAFGPARVNGGAGVEPLIDGEIAGDNLAPVVGMFAPEARHAKL